MSLRDIHARTHDEGPIPSYVTSVQDMLRSILRPPFLRMKVRSRSMPPRPVIIADVICDGHHRWPFHLCWICASSPSTLEAGASTQIKAVVNNDALNAGVNWTVICGSSDCGSFNPAKTTSGVVTTYTAPAIVPSGGTVQVTATSVTDPTKASAPRSPSPLRAARWLLELFHSCQRPVSGAPDRALRDGNECPLSPEIGESIRAETPAMENIGSSTDTARNVLD